MSALHPDIYISHAWGGESERITNLIMEKFDREGIRITMDKKDLGYRMSINEFMKKLGEADAIIIVVSQKYLHSEYCMFELLQIYENKDILNRIFPVVLDEVNIAKSTDRLDLVKYWEGQTKELEDKIRDLGSLSNIEGITDDLNLYNAIRGKIAKLTSILKDINTLNITLHTENDFNDLYNAVRKRINQNELLNPPSPIQDTPSPTSASSPLSSDENSAKTQPLYQIPPPKTKKKKNWLWLLILPIALLGYFGYTQLGGEKSALSSNDPEEVTLPPANAELDEQTLKSVKNNEEKTTRPPATPSKKKTETQDRPISEQELESVLKDRSNDANTNQKPAFPMNVKLYLDKKFVRSMIAIDGKPLASFDATKTLNVIEIELLTGIHKFVLMKSNDTCRVNLKIDPSREEYSLICD